METSLDDPYPSILLAGVSDLPFSFLLINGIVLLLLLAMSGVVSGAEVAFFSLNTRDLDQNSDKRVINLLQEPRQLLATILILNNLINVLIVTLSTYATWQVVGDKNADGAVIAGLTAIITVLIIFFGEIVPKVYASQHSLAFARLVSGFIMIFNRGFKPLSWFLMSVSGVIEKRIGKKGYELSVDELNEALEITSSTESVSDEEKGILKGIVNFGTLSVKQVMRSRVDIMAVDLQTTFHELLDQINKTRFSRIPVYNETIDKIEGILYIKDVLPHLHEEEHYEWQGLLRQGFFVPESKKIDDLFKDFQQKQVHVAIVVDEYGGTEGLITMEDIIEEIVGEINDEFDEESEIDYKKLDEQTFMFEGRTSLNDFCKVADQDSSIFDEVKGESESIGGLLLEINGELPSTGEQIKHQHFKFTVMAVDKKRIKRVRVNIEENSTNNETIG
ncbi:MAG: gliding motility-associated protein GldE [Cyclobacteriaceae bacterium]